MGQGYFRKKTKTRKTINRQQQQQQTGQARRLEASKDLGNNIGGTRVNMLPRNERQSQ
jgi:hypothetical protein